MKKKLPSVLERDIEKYLVKEVKRIGGWAPKWVSPGNISVPDRIVFFPNGKVVFVECKATGKKPTPLQVRTIKMMRVMGQETIVIDSKELVDIFIETVLDLFTKKEEEVKPDVKQ